MHQKWRNGSRRSGWFGERHRHYLAAKGLTRGANLAAKGISTSRGISVRNRNIGDKFGWKDGGSHESVKNYVDDNVKSRMSPNRRVDGFKNAVKFQTVHPFKDMDEEWKEYTAIADNKYYGPTGKPEPLSHDRLRRAVQRGAATFSRVASQANMEMFIDDEKGRSFRDSMNDFMFGRRTEEKFNPKDFNKEKSV